MSQILKNIALITITILIAWSAKSQENSIKSCDSFLNSGYVSDGQEYIAKPDENNKAKFHTTFFGGSQYRIVACSDVEEIPLILTVFDTEKNLLFCNKSYDYTPFWNFTFTSTIDCIIEIEFDNEILIQNEVLLLIGFKEK
jgi:hypothetical protein